MLARLGRSLVAGCVAAAGLGALGLVIALFTGRSLPVTACWTILLGGTLVLVVAALLLLGRTPSPNRRPGDGRDAPKADPADQGAGTPSAVRRAAAHATSSERESLADTGFSLVAVGATIVAWGFVVSAVFRV